MVIAYAKGTFLPWRMVAWLSIIYTVVPVIFIHMFVPESPVWLVSKQRIEDAARSLKFLYKNYPQPEHTVINTYYYLFDMIVVNHKLCRPIIKKFLLYFYVNL